MAKRTIAPGLTGDDTVWRKLLEKLPGIVRTHVKVGAVGSSGAASHGGITNAELAAIHEYGAPGAGIPRRSFILATFEAKREDLKKMQVKVARALVEGRMEVAQAFGLLGAWAAAEVRKTIVDGLVEPKLQASEAGLRTIARKGSSKTLFDSGALANSITWVLEE